VDISGGAVHAYIVSHFGANVKPKERNICGPITSWAGGHYYHVASNNKSETPQGVSDSSSVFAGYFPFPIPPRLPGVSALLAPSLGAEQDSLPESVMDEFAGSVGGV
jgi:hypothetical protein